MVLSCFPIALLCFWFCFSLALARSSIFLLFLMVSYGFLIDLNRQPSPDLLHGVVRYSYGFGMFLLNFNCRPSIFSCLTALLWFCIVHLWRWYVFDWSESSALARSSASLWVPLVLYGIFIYFGGLILIVGPRPILGCLTVFLWFCMVFLWFNEVLAWLLVVDPRLGFLF